MIPVREIKEKAREHGVPPSTIERDYAQNWLLAQLGTLDMALKGGTGIRKVYIEGYRFSDDLDFTLLEPYDVETLKSNLAEALGTAREESGIRFQDTLTLITTVSGFRATVYFTIIPSAGNIPISIKIDLTGHENEILLLPVQKKHIHHEYSDNLDASVTSYALEEIAAEKIRALFERTRARDIYDVWYLSQVVQREDVHPIISGKCERKGVRLSAAVLMEKRDRFLAAWEVSLRHQLRTIPEFDEAFGRVISEVEWHEENVPL